ncbi:hypothetical protein RR48_01971 [Papilio machaon]|uniref:Uncharacterized protein n=1 Tax=Papilio machaon TaxID=76193 RepID=A0A0N1IQ15_PAPMA|nr:hypothetical protein RR48_01971 [Papilio machaon]
MLLQHLRIVDTFANLERVSCTLSAPTGSGKLGEHKGELSLFVDTHMHVPMEIRVPVSIRGLTGAQSAKGSRTYGYPP